MDATADYSDPGGTIDGAANLPDSDNDAGNSITENVDFRDSDTAVDTDGDGVNAIDIDDDNDGIPILTNHLLLGVVQAAVVLPSILFW